MARGFLHDEQCRRRWQTPEAILAEIRLCCGMTFADIGCGEGFFVLPAARIVGETGIIYALDESDDAISRLNQRAASEGLTNITSRVASAEDTILCDHCADIVFFGIVLHDFKDPRRVLTNAMKMLKPTGILVDLDWKREPMDVGPPLVLRFSEQEASKLIMSANFTIELTKGAGPYHYVVVARP